MPNVTAPVRLDAAPVPPDLRPYVWALVERRDTVPMGTAIELPDPNPLLQFVIGADYLRRRREGGGDFAPAPPIALIGPTAAVSEARVAGPVHVFCAVLTHLGATTLAQCSVAPLVDRRVGVKDLDLPDEDVVARLQMCPSFRARSAIVIRWLRNALASRRLYCERDVKLTGAIAQGLLVGTVSSIAEDMGVSVRGLHKRLSRMSGWSPKRLLRIARLQSVLKQIHPKPWDDPDGRDVMLEFHDQAHFAKDFKQLTGVTPSQYGAAKRKLGDRLINTLFLT